MTSARPDPGSIRLRTNAKLNLFLRVLGRRSDGYHDLESIFHGIDLADDLTVEALDPPNIEIGMSIDRGMPDDVPAREDNFVFHAARRLGAGRGGARIEIHKRIPFGSGLGGGSANAAGALVALDELWGLGSDQAELAEVAAAVGSDVPYFLVGGTALAMDRGGDLTALAAPRSLSFVLGLSFEPLSTGPVYEAWDQMGSTARAGSAPMALALGAGDAAEVAALLHNDLEAPACTLRPELAERKERLVAAGALGAGMSGSGPTLFGIAADPEHARAIAGEVAGDFDRVATVVSAPQAVERLP